MLASCLSGFCGDFAEGHSFPFRLGRKSLLHLFAVGINAKRLAEMAVPVRMVDATEEYVSPVWPNNPPVTVAALPYTAEAAPFARLDRLNGKHS